jgi:hypothetical protein
MDGSGTTFNGLDFDDLVGLILLVELRVTRRLVKVIASESSGVCTFDLLAGEHLFSVLS